MIVVGELLGDADEPRFSTRSVETMPVAWHEASRRRLRRQTEQGTDVAVDLPQAGYLRDGAVLADDGQRIVVVRRPPERVVRVRFDAALSRVDLVTAVSCVTHAFANQHVPVEAVEDELRVPVTTSDEIAQDTVRKLDLPGVTVEVADLPVGARQPLSAGHQHGAPR